MLILGACAVVLTMAALVLFLVLPALAMRDAQREEHKNERPPRY